MKNKYVYLILFFAGSLFNSCGPDTATPELDMPFTGELPGRWYPVESIIKGNSYPHTRFEECLGNYIEFGDNGEYNEATYLNCLNNTTRQATFIIEGSQIYVHYSPTITKELFIKELSLSNLQLITTDDYFGDGHIQEVITNYSRE